MGTEEKIKSKGISRRDFNRLAAMFGFTAAFGALEMLGGNTSLAQAEETAKNISDEFSKVKPDYVIRMGISGNTLATSPYVPVGYFKFAKELHRRTEGKIEVKLYGANSVCNEISCPQKLLTGTFEGSGSSTQNAAQTYKFLNCLDFPYLFPSRASVHHLLYSKECEKYFRKVLRDKYKVEFLWSHVELRDLFTGQKYANKPNIRVPSDFANAKVRVTATNLGRIGLKQMGLNPIPLNWSETLEGLRSGVVDGQETMAGAVAGWNMAPVTSQVIGAQFMAGTECAMISSKFFNKLPTKYQEILLETAFDMQRHTQKEVETAYEDRIGYQDPPKSGTVFAKSKVRVNILTKDELNEWKKMADAHLNPDPYSSWRKKIQKIAGKDVFEIFYNKAREISEDTPAMDVKPQKWWV